jgi:nucleotide-binding universal stress UspA family protein
MAIEGQERTMTMITVAVDGSPDSLHALGWAARLADATGARLLAVSALVPVESELWPSRWEQQRSGRAADLDRWCATTSVEVERHVVEGDPRDQLLRVAVERGADLLVVGSGDVSGPGANRLRIGSVAEYLARHAEVALAVVPPAAPLDVGSIVVGFDGSEASTTAARWAAEVAAARGATLTGVAAVTPTGAPTADEVRRRWDEIGTGAVLDVATSDAKAPTVLVDEARRRTADLVVVGMRGLGGFLGLRIGSTALGVLHDLDATAIVLIPVG